MYHREHGVAHFHAEYGEHGASYAVSDGSVLGGGLPRRADALVREWAALHRVELLDNWRRAVSHEALTRINPLD